MADHKLKGQRRTHYVIALSISFCFGPSEYSFCPFLFYYTPSSTLFAYHSGWRLHRSRRTFIVPLPHILSSIRLPYLFNPSVLLHKSCAIALTSPVPRIFCIFPVCSTLQGRSPHGIFDPSMGILPSRWLFDISPYLRRTCLH